MSRGKAETTDHVPLKMTKQVLVNIFLPFPIFVPFDRWSGGSVVQFSALVNHNRTV